MGFVGEKGDGKILSLCTARPSLLCFLLLSFGKGKVMDGIVDAFDKKEYDVGGLVSLVQ
jgi:hypothetical protein